MTVKEKEKERWGVNIEGKEDNEIIEVFIYLCETDSIRSFSETLSTDVNTVFSNLLTWKVNKIDVG